GARGRGLRTGRRAGAPRARFRALFHDARPRDRPGARRRAADRRGARRTHRRRRPAGRRRALRHSAARRARDAARRHPRIQGRVKPRILIVDDEERMVGVVAAALGRAGWECEGCASGEAALAALEARGADAVVTDWKMPQMDGIELLRRLHARRTGLPVILLTAYASVPSAVAAMREGAFDYVTKPFDNDELRATVARALELRRLERENRWLRQEVGTRYGPDAIVAESARSRELLSLVRRVAPSRAAVLVQGESGTGKELVARLLHYWSERVGRPFV